MHHGVVNPACRKTPPLRLTSLETSEGASPGRAFQVPRPEQDIRRPDHSSVPGFRLYQLPTPAIPQRAVGS